MNAIENLHRHYRIDKVAKKSRHTVKEYLFVEGYVQAMKDHGVLLIDVPQRNLAEEYQTELYKIARKALAKW